MTLIATATVTVTMLDQATIFDLGVAREPAPSMTEPPQAEAVYRYDLPLDGIAEGWAVAAVVEQIRSIASDYWPEIDVLIDGPDDARAVLERALRNAGVASSAYPSTDSFEPIEADREPGRHRILRPEGDTRWHVPRVALLGAGTVVVVVMMIALGMAVRQSPQPEAESPAAQVVSGVDKKPSSSAMPTSAPEPPPPPAPPTTVIDHEGFTVTVPAGFVVSPEKKRTNTVMLTGADPDLRVHVAVDPLYSVPKQALFDEVTRLVETDPELDTPVRTEDRFTYVEHPKDGSMVRWTTWVDADKQLSVGCHSRVAQTMPQNAACSMATDSLKLKK